MPSEVFKPTRAQVKAALMGRTVQCAKHPRRPAQMIEYEDELAWVCDACGPVVVGRAPLPKEE